MFLRKKIITNLHSYGKIKLEYIWLDGYEPTQNLRSKTKVEEHENFKGTLEEIEMVFDGSSTKQAEGGSSDCLLVPVAIYPDPTHQWLLSNDRSDAC
jgi:glutamine synthetase